MGDVYCNEKAGRAFCKVVIEAIHKKTRERGGSASMSGSEWWAYPPAIEGFDEAIEAAILAERQRCADVAQKEGDGYKEAGLPQSAMGAYTTRRAILGI